MTTHTSSDDFPLGIGVESQETCSVSSSSVCPHIDGANQPFSSADVLPGPLSATAHESRMLDLMASLGTDVTMPPPTIFRRIRGRATMTETTQLQQTTSRVFDEKVVAVLSLRNMVVGRELLRNYGDDKSFT